MPKRGAASTGWEFFLLLQKIKKNSEDMFLEANGVFQGTKQFRATKF